MAPQQPLYSPLPPPPATRKLNSSDGPMVWIDCEMTGLDVKQERIIEIACIITDGQLQEVDPGVAYAIRTPKPVLDAMGEWCTRQHASSGLTAACLDPSISKDHADVRAAILAYVRDRIPDAGAGVLSGNTVHADATFLRKEMPELMSHLSYRIIDVSSVKELVSRFYGTNYKWTGGLGTHRALDDIRGSIAELKHYRKHVFVPPITR